MDYPPLNMIFGLVIIFMVVVNIGLRILLSKLHLPIGVLVLSWVALMLSILAALYIEVLFLRFMTPGFNWQIAFGALVTAGIGALVTASLYRRMISPRFSSILLAAQMTVSLISLLIAFGLYRSLVPIGIP